MHQSCFHLKIQIQVCHDLSIQCQGDDNTTFLVSILIIHNAPVLLNVKEQNIYSKLTSFLKINHEIILLNNIYMNIKYNDSVILFIFLQK